MVREGKRDMNRKDASQTHIVSISSGLSSALVACRVIERYGMKNTRFVFMDTTIEDIDNYRFLNEFADKFGIELVVLKDGRDPYQVATDKQIIPNQKIAPCTMELKIKLFRKYIEQFDPSKTTIHIGFDFSEVHRCKDTDKNYGAMGFKVDYPLLWKPYEYRPYTEVSRMDWRIEPPRMYDRGYSHANCSGLCVKQGQGDWIRTLIHEPEKYARIETWEQQMRTGPRANYALVRDQSGGEVTPLTLRELRLKHEAKTPLSLFDSQNVCITCGVG